MPATVGEAKWHREEVREEMREAANRASKAGRIPAYSISRFAKLLVPYMAGVNWDDNGAPPGPPESCVHPRDSMLYSAKFHKEMERAKQASITVMVLLIRTSTEAVYSLSASLGG